MMGKITVLKEPILAEIERFIRGLGYVPGDIAGHEGLDPYNASLKNYFSILCIRRKVNNHSFLGFKWKTKGRRIHLLMADMSEPEWIFHVYGKENMEESCLVARRFAESFDVDIKIKLDCKEIRTERYSGDGML